jgi:S1-C subfamily serine protease
VKSSRGWTEKAGILKGDIVVAVDGVRVWTLDQSAVLYDRSFDAPLVYTVWRGGGYRDIKAPFRQHYYGVDAEPYTNRSK